VGGWGGVPRCCYCFDSASILRTYPHTPNATPNNPHPTPPPPQDKAHLLQVPDLAAQLQRPALLRRRLALPPDDRQQLVYRVKVVLYEGVVLDAVELIHGEEGAAGGG